jgi:hypothetical protein
MPKSGGVPFLWDQFGGMLLHREPGQLGRDLPRAPRLRPVITKNERSQPTTPGGAPPGVFHMAWIGMTFLRIVIPLYRLV